MSMYASLESFGEPDTDSIQLFLHCYAFDCVTHHLFHPHGSDSILKQSDEETLCEAVFDNSLASE
jgi:hypothetical protein